MEKINTPQIYVFNNHIIAEALSEDYIVGEGDLGSYVEADFPQYVSTLYFNAGYNFANNLHEYDIWIQDFQNRFPEKHLIDNDEPYGTYPLIQIKYPRKCISEAPMALHEMYKMLSDNKLRIVFAAADYEEQYDLFTASSKDHFSYDDSKRFGLYDTFNATPYAQSGEKFDVEGTVFSELLNEYCDGYDVIFELPTMYDCLMKNRTPDPDFSL